jgi:hypothetical protein
VPALDADGVRRPERDVCAGRDAVSTWLLSDRVQREVVARTAPEQDVSVAFELTLAQHCESKFHQRRLVQMPTRGKVAHPDANGIDYLTHGSRCAW